jgi:hypothetical protein
MRLGIVVAVSLACLGLSACAGDSEGDDGGDGDDEGVDWSTANPPPNIDITSCVDIPIPDDGSASAIDDCSACCTSAGFETASSLYDDRCTCGNSIDDEGETVCQAAADPASSDSCDACCTDAGYSVMSWLGGTPASCSCFVKHDDAICAASLPEVDSADACFLCCLHSGFISGSYGSGDFGGEETCDCIAP